LNQIILRIIRPVTGLVPGSIYVWNQNWNTDFRKKKLKLKTKGLTGKLTAGSSLDYPKNRTRTKSDFSEPDQNLFWENQNCGTGFWVFHLRIGTTPPELESF
jgi:hypothetical protein